MRTIVIEDLIKEFSNNVYMYIPLTIILQSCLGSIAAMLILMQGASTATFIQLTLCVSLCMFYNAALLAQLRAKFSFWILVASLVINSVLVVINIF